MKTIKIIGPIFSLAAILIATWLAGTGHSLASETNAVAGAKLAPGWELKDLEGKTLRAANLKGKVIIVDFWATWCPPCRAEIPELITLQKKYAAQGFTVIGVSVDQAGLKTVKSFAEKHGINYPIVLTDRKVEDAFGGIDALPTTFIIDRRGKIAKQHLGFTEPTVIENEVIALLAQ